MDSFTGLPLNSSIYFGIVVQISAHPQITKNQTPSPKFFLVAKVFCDDDYHADK